MSGVYDSFRVRAVVKTMIRDVRKLHRNKGARDVQLGPDLTAELRSPRPSLKPPRAARLKSLIKRVPLPRACGGESFRLCRFEDVLARTPGQRAEGHIRLASRSDSGR